jgi:simple sugar transport system ATP-binding protein
MTAVSMEGITKRFPLVVANDDVDFEVRWGEVHALIGENGAGKSTLMKILYGMQPPDSGTIRIDGKPVTLNSASDAIALNIGMVHQHFMLLEPLTVTENIILGSEPHAGPAIDYRKARRDTTRLLERFGFALNPDTQVGTLPLGLQQQVEILKVLYRDARILIMDEPTAVLTPQETRGLFTFIREFADEGNAVIFISHKLDEVMEICDRMSVMRDGVMIGTVSREETDQRQLANMMVGREVILRVSKEPASPREVRLSVRDLQVADQATGQLAVNGVSLDVRAGEVLGVAGIEGNGQSQLVECIAGLQPAAAGAVFMDGRDVTGQSSRDRRQNGLSHIPENRYERGLVPTFSAAMNSVLGDHYHPPFSAGTGFLDETAINAHADALIRDYDVRPASKDVVVTAYSGGNAQKLIVARELERPLRILLAAQPTRGVDIGAIEFIHRQIIRARDSGLAVLLVSADLNEVMSLSDRIVVMHEGRIRGELSAQEATPEKLGLLMAGSSYQEFMQDEPAGQSGEAG